MNEQISEAQSMEWEYCPSCAGELDTGFECNTCERDWRPWATLDLSLTESGVTQ
jgi:hypothetical protein